MNREELAEIKTCVAIVLCREQCGKLEEFNNECPTKCDGWEDFIDGVDTAFSQVLQPYLDQQIKEAVEKVQRESDARLEIIRRLTDAGLKIPQEIFGYLEERFGHRGLSHMEFTMEGSDYNEYKRAILSLKGETK